MKKSLEYISLPLAIAILVLMGWFIVHMIAGSYREVTAYAQAPTNGGQGFPANGVLTPIAGDVGIGSDSGVLTGYDSAGNKFPLKPSSGSSGVVVGTQITYTQVCQKGKGNIPAGYTNTCTLTITAIH